MADRERRESPRNVRLRIYAPNNEEILSEDVTGKNHIPRIGEEIVFSDRSGGRDEFESRQNLTVANVRSDFQIIDDFQGGTTMHQVAEVHTEGAEWEHYERD